MKRIGLNTNIAAALTSELGYNVFRAYYHYR